MHGDFIAIFQCLKEAYREAGERRFFRNMGTNCIRNNGYKWKERKFGITKKCLCLRVMRCWNRLSREVVDAPALEVFKAVSDPVQWEVPLPMAGNVRAR